MIASLSSGIPSTAVYLVLPASIALMAASLMLAGVSKSGSPAPRPMTLRPAAFSARALSVTAIVADGFTRASAADRKDIIISGFWREKTRLGASLFLRTVGVQRQAKSADFAGTFADLRDGRLTFRKGRIARAISGMRKAVFSQRSCVSRDFGFVMDNDDQLQRLEAAVWVTIGLIGAALACCALTGHFAFDWRSFLAPVAVTAMLAAGGWLYRSLRQEARLGAIL